MLPLSRRIAVSANVIFFPCTRLEIKFILSYLILSYAYGWLLLFPDLSWPGCFNTFPDSKVHVANMGPTWVLSSRGGPHVGPMNLAISVDL